MEKNNIDLSIKFIECKLNLINAFEELSKINKELSAINKKLFNNEKLAKAGNELAECVLKINDICNEYDIDLDKMIKLNEMYNNENN